MARLQTTRWTENLYEVLAVGIVGFGFFLARSAGSPVAAYVAVFLSGLMFGRIAYFSHKKSKLPLAVLLMAFLVGFLTGSVVGNVVVLGISLALGAYAGHEIHRLKLIPLTP